MNLNHIHMKIDTALRMARGSKSERRKIELLFNMHPDRVIIELQKMQARGLTVISSKDCDNRSVTGECLGHRSTLEAVK